MTYTQLVLFELLIIVIKGEAKKSLAFNRLDRFKL